MSTSSGTPESWISSFCALPGHEYFAEVSEEFIEDDFNLTGLQTQVAMYKEALEVRGALALSGFPLPSSWRDLMACRNAALQPWMLLTCSP
jgi:hypothetical protein